MILKKVTALTDSGCPVGVIYVDFNFFFFLKKFKMLHSKMLKREKY